VSLIAHNQWEAMKSWKWTRVLMKMVKLGFFYFVMAVGVGKLVNVGLR